MNRIIAYISGYGRSGSTLLDVILGSHDSVTSLGEAGNLFRLYLDEKDYCSCGRTLYRCTMWSEVMERAFPHLSEETLESYQRVQRSTERWTSLHLLLLPGSAITLKNAYARITKRLVNAIFEVNQRRVIVDSSKSAYGFAWRAAALHKLCGFDVRIIHLVRDGRGVMHSKIKGNDRKLRAGLPAEERLAAYRGLAGWIIANCVSIITRYFLPRGCYHLVKYEDLMSKPEAELKKLGHFLQLDLSNQIGKIRFNELFDVGHLVAGNRLTMQKSVALQFDVGATDDLPASLKIMYCLFGWPILAYLSIVRLMNNGGQEVLEGDGKSASVH